MRKTLITSFAILALSFGVAACGSDDSGDETLTQAQLIEQADEICSTTNSDLVAKVDENLTEESTQEDAEAFIGDEIVPLYRDQIEQLRALEPDEESADSYNEMIDTLESELQAVEDDPSLMTTQDTAFPEATEQAKAFGLKVCGSGGQS